jgi:hypothetical protein
MNRALAWLQMGDFARGWAEYEWRWRCPEHPVPDLETPLWDGARLDGRTIDAIVKCNLDQLEKLQPVMLDVPTLAAPRQRTQVDVPQLSSFPAARAVSLAGGAGAVDRLRMVLRPCRRAGVAVAAGFKRRLGSIC